MDEHVRGARRGAVAALITGVRNPDFSRRQFVRETKKSPIGTGVGAEAFLSQKINGQNPQMKRKGMATATEGKVSQKLLVTRWLVNFGKSGPVAGFEKKRYAVGQTNM